MATAKPGITSEDPAQLSKIMAAARIENDKLMEEFANRAEEIEALETEIIDNYTNSDECKLASTPDHIQIQLVLGATQRFLSRVTEIHAGAIRNLAKQTATRNMLFNAILPLMQGGSAEVRNAKASDCVQGIGYMIELEEGLINICELATKNLKTAQEMASRTLKAFELDLTFFDGASTFSAIVAANKRRYINNG
jgi:hypothetical protein